MATIILVTQLDLIHIPKKIIRLVQLLYAYINTKKVLYLVLMKVMFLIKKL